MPATMPSPASNLQVDPTSPPPETDLDPLQRQILQIAELLPTQGPITAFVFLNALQGLEHLPFDQGVKEGARLFRTQPYLAEEAYREKLTTGRIRILDVKQGLRDDLGNGADEILIAGTTRYQLRLAMLQFPLRTGTADELRWFMDETDALRKMRPETPPQQREQFLRETKHWIMRDGRAPGKDRHYRPDASDLRAQTLLSELIERYGSANMEQWSPATWEACSLEALWRVCLASLEGMPPPQPTNEPPLRHRDLLLAATGEDSDVLVHEVLIRFCAAFADQGFADWPLPARDQGFFQSFCTIYGQPGGPPDRWLAGLPAEIARLQVRGMTPLDSIRESLQLLGVKPEQEREFLTGTILALQGWAGLLWQLESRGDRVPVPAPTGTLIEFVAVRLILERLALAYLANDRLGYDGSLAELFNDERIARFRRPSVSVEQRAFLVFQLAQVLGWSVFELHSLSRDQWERLIQEIESFHSFERRRLFHLAYERQFRVQALDAIVAQSRKPVRQLTKPRFQAVFCIDTREAAFARQLEEIASDVETFQVAGFFGVAMYYRGVADAHFTALCPIVVRPKHWVIEETVLPLEQTNRFRAQTRRALGATSLGIHRGSRNLAGGALLTATCGVLATIPLVARVLFPRWTATLTRTAQSFVAPPAITRLRLERQTPEPGPADEQIGFSVEEMADIGERMLRDMGLTHNFARLVLFVGHGSHCLNNPHKSSYDCGACCGSPGGPNARALAAFLNDRRVRQILESRGVSIPPDTWFLGGLHNTATDTITFSDLDLLPKSHYGDFEQAQATIQEALQRNAHERCRRFYSAPLDISPAAAHRHVDARSEDLAQTRPEFGNASNALCFVGRRSRIRGLYLDRRSFVQSYDFFSDDEESTILARVLAPVIPVCQGINLMYYFSAVDPTGWGCGTKLPHNVTSLLGVMDGYASDLRPGLPQQGVEIHEPMRLLFVIETTPERMQSIMDRNETVGRILRNGWAQLALLDPFSDQVHVYENGKFEPYVPEVIGLPKATSSVDWYRGWRDHLGFASIEPLSTASNTEND